MVAAAQANLSANINKNLAAKGGGNSSKAAILSFDPEKDRVNNIELKSNSNRDSRGNGHVTGAGKISIETTDVVSTIRNAASGEYQTAAITENSSRKRSLSPSVEPISPRELQRMRMLLGFRCLDLVISRLVHGKKVPAWTLVREGVLQLDRGRYADGSGIGSFTLQDLAALLTVWPQSFQLTWRMLSLDSYSKPDYHLCVELMPHDKPRSIDVAPEGTGRSNSAAKLESTEVSTPVENSRQLQFEHALVEAMKQLQTDEEIVPNMQLLPSVPVPASSAAARKIANRKGAAAVLGLQPSSGAVTGGTGTHEPVDMQVLRNRLVAKEKESQALSRAYNQQQQRYHAIRRVQSLPAVCDSLRSMWLAGRGGSHAVLTSEVLSRIAPALDVGEVELLTRLQLLGREFPEFLTIVKSDDLLGASTVCVYVSVPYGELRKRVQQWVTQTLKQIDAKFGGAVAVADTHASLVTNRDVGLRLWI